MLILITNDDGVASPGLRAAVQAALPLGEVIVFAPARPWSGASRSMPAGSVGAPIPYPLTVNGQTVAAFQVDASPALVVLRALIELQKQRRRPALLISGVNYGENLGFDTTVSGTVGAALQAATAGVPALAVSLQTPKETHADPSNTVAASVDFSAAVHFTRFFAQWMLKRAAALPFDVDALKVDIPADATPATPWRLTRVSRRSYFVAASPPTEPPDYIPLPNPEEAEPDSDIYALRVQRLVSVAPLSLDLTSRADFGDLDALLRGPAPDPFRIC